MILRWLCFISILSVFSISVLHAQEFSNGDPNSTPPPGVDKFYWELSRSRDGVTRSLAERYLNTVKLSEWSDLSGKFKTYARYIKHDPNLTSVTIEIAKGRGAERTTDQKTIPVDKLSKTSQSRVRQIDMMQKRLKELAAKPGPDGVVAGPGAPMADGPGVDPLAAGSGAAGPEAGGPASPPVAAEEAPDPSENEPDPLGFAELPPVTPDAGALGPPGGPGSIPPGVTPEGLPQSSPTPPAGP
jgi:hypothetical protein